MNYYTFIGTMIILITILLGFLAKYNQKFLVPSIIGLIITFLIGLFHSFSTGEIDINQTYAKVAIVVGVLNQIFMIVKPVKGSLIDKISYNFILPWFTGFSVGLGIYLYSEDLIAALFLILFAVGVELVLFSRK